MEMTTCIPRIRAAMKRNGSPKAIFTTDENRLWFVVELPVHRRFKGEATSQVTAQAATEVTPQVQAILNAAEKPRQRDELQVAAGIKHREHFRKQYLLPLLESGLIEMTIPDKPRSSKQEYRLTAAGRDLLSSLKTEN